VLIPTTLLPTTTVSQPSTTTTSLPPVVETTTTLPVVETTTTLPVVETLQDISTKSNEEIAAIATNPGMLATVSSQEAAQIFESLDVAELSDEQTEELVAAVQEAPLEVRQQFEDKIDVFKSGLDTYVPIGSTIPVGTRRTLIAVTAGISLAAAGTRIRR
jgi:isopentenyl diphosphate isomerase/L-lactate dehydrogenase-like FMN-dependent dehydrogenase